MPMRTIENVVLVNDRDEAIGTMEKLEAHEKGELHRAFSVFLFNTEGRLLLQRRALEKYHSAGLWTNTCCGHPRPGEMIPVAAARRLEEELGVRCDPRFAFAFQYKAEVGNGLVEHEIDHVLFGAYDGQVAPNAAEVSSTRWMRMNDLADDLRTSPEHYTKWLVACWPQVWAHYITRQRATS